MRKANMPKAGAGKAPGRWKDNVMNERFSVRRRPWADRDGAVLILSLLILAMITVLGVYTATRTAMEQQIANNMENQVEAFFSAEAGISHGRQVMQNAFVKYNEELMKSPATGTKAKLPNWSFMLNGTYNGKVAGTYWCGGYPMWSSPDCAGGASPINGPWTTHGVEVLNRTITVGSKTVQYSVMVWDNIDYMFSALLEADNSYQGSDGSIKVIPPPYDLCEQPQVKYDSTGKLDINLDDLAGCYQNYNPVEDRDGSVFVRSTGTVSVGGQVVATAAHELTFQGLIAGKGQIIPGLAQEFANEGHSSSGMDLHDISAGNLSSGTTL
ncbi:MAG: pilus assembly PilX N-terminal domain-containing protein [Nitrospinota bacterium]|nr:pilus assembly PilX N-terminal domain-containing protein [Nitrospinota bacterium]